jgi:proline dehydrogenase
VAPILFARVADRLGQPFVIENRPGATGTIGAAAVARADGDGYTILHDATGLSVNPALIPNMPFVAERDFAFVFLATLVPNLLVTNNATPQRTVPEVIARAKQYDSFVRLDMESSAYTDRTLDTFEQKLFPGHENNVGVVLQSSLRRTLDDVARANRLSARVRICKGAYLEPPAVAFPEKADVDKNYVAAMHTLMTEGRYPGIATHDEAIIAEAKRFAKEKGIAPDKFEFQMLYGVRRDLQEQIVKEGYRMRVYVPFGSQWYPYLMRRLAERPANIAFMAGNIVKESLGG